MSDLIRIADIYLGCFAAGYARSENLTCGPGAKRESRRCHQIHAKPSRERRPFVS
jgi:hypothetical protein